MFISLQQVHSPEESESLYLNTIESKNIEIDDFDFNNSDDTVVTLDENGEINEFSIEEELELWKKNPKHDQYMIFLMSVEFDEDLDTLVF